MRVIAGKARRLPLKTVPGDDTRPTQDRIKETLFNILMPDLPGCVFADLFSGSGGIGIEALSRGARKAYFVENSPKAMSCIQENLAFTKLAGQAVTLKMDAAASLHHIFEKEVDIIFMDPPYGQGLERQMLTLLKDRSYVTDDTLIIVEARLDEDFSYVSSLGFEAYREKRYKTNKHVFIRRGENEEGSLSGQL
ncbi:MAG: 16S rRNA (guanine(966)-N(2))-methyltransferase RsmD [Lachnospiraceae bacterium]|nr:16S rRNA (guanine(966)-N(2))-methyltransferase RsmD [Lachnospiraceae bacterium]